VYRQAIHVVALTFCEYLNISSGQKKIRMNKLYFRLRVGKGAWGRKTGLRMSRRSIPVTGNENGEKRPVIDGPKTSRFRTGAGYGCPGGVRLQVTLYVTGP